MTNETDKKSSVKVLKSKPEVERKPVNVIGGPPRPGPVEIHTPRGRQ